MILFPLFCFLFLNRILQNLCLASLFLSIKLARRLTWDKRRRGSFPPSRAPVLPPCSPPASGVALGVTSGVTSSPKHGFPWKRDAPPATRQCGEMHDEHTNAYRENSHLIIARTRGFIQRFCFLCVFKSCAPKTEN